MSRIFLSHSSSNNGAAVAVREWLSSEGWDDVFLDLDPHRGLKAGERWQEALKQASSRCELVLFLISPAWVASKWCLAEFLLAKQMNKRIFGVIVEQTPFEDLPGEMTAEWQLVDLTAGALDHETEVTLPPGDRTEKVAFSGDGLNRMRIGLLNAGLDPKFFAWPPEDDPERPPWRGLKPLEAEDAGIFFGRDGPIVEVLDRLRGLREAAPPRMLVILGASGAGKSSFMRAGLLPRLGRDRRHIVVLPVVRPNRAAISGETGLVACLEGALKAEGARVSRADIRKAVEGGADKVRDLLAPLVPEGAEGARAPTLVLPVDQGEELFLSDGGEEASALLSLLAGLLDGDGPALATLVTIRSDSYEALQTATELEAIGQQTWSLPPMPKGAYGRVIEGPAERLAGTERALSIDGALTDALLTDIEAGGAKDALPLLAFTLERLYREHGGDGDLKLAEYEDLGRVKGSIEAAVEEALKAADGNASIPAGRTARLALLRRGLIPWLAGIDPESGAPRRRVAKLSEIPEEARPLIELLVEQRLLATDVDRETGETTVEPAHEALLRQWGLLEGWLDEDFEDLATAEGVKRSAREWEANARDGGWLAHAGGRLETAEAVAGRADLAKLFTAADRDYLKAARQAEETRRKEEAERELRAANERAAAARRIARRTMIGLAASLILAVLAGIAGFAAYQNQKEAEAQARAAEGQRRLAVVQSKRAQAAARAANAERRRAEEQTRIANDARGREQAAEANRVATISEQLLDAGRGDLAVELALDASAPYEKTGAPMSPRIEDVLRRAYGSVALPAERQLIDNAFNIAVSPDGSTIAAGTAGNQETRGWVHVFDAATMRERFRARAGDDAVSGLAFSPDGTRIVVAGSKLPTVWRVADGRKLFDLKLPDGTKFSTKALFSPDGTRIAVGTSENRALIFDADTGAQLHVLEGSSFDDMLERARGHNTGSFGFGDPIALAVAKTTWQIWGSATEVAFSPDGSRLAVTGPANPDASVRLFDMGSGELLRVLSDGTASLLGGVMGYGNSLAISADGGKVIASPVARTIKIWNTSDGRLVDELAAIGVASFFVSVDGRALVSGHGNGSLVFRCLGSVSQVTAIKAHDAAVSSLSPDFANGLFVSTSNDGTAKLWRLPGSDEICSASSDFVDKESLQTMRPLRVFSGHRASVHKAFVTAGGKSVVTVSRDGFLRVWPVDAPDSVFVAAGPLDEYGTPDVHEREQLASFSGDGRTVFVRGSPLQDYSAFDAGTGAPVEQERTIRAVAPEAAGGKAIAFATASKSWVVGEDRKDADQRTRFSSWRGQVSPRGDRLIERRDGASFGEYRHALIDVASGKDLAMLQLDGVDAGNVAFSADGSRILGRVAVEKPQNAARIALWDAQTGDLIAATEPIERLGAPIAALRPSGDAGRVLANWEGTQLQPFLFTLSGRKFLPPRAVAAGQGPRLLTASALSPDGTLAFFGRDDGIVVRLPLRGGSRAELFATGGVPIRAMRMSKDGSLLALADAASTVWIMDARTGFVMRTLGFGSDVTVLAFDNPGRRLLACAIADGCRILPTRAGTDDFADAAELADWFRAVRPGNVSDEDRRRYGISAPQRARRADVEAIAPYPVPPRRENPAPSADTAECDRLADNPYDRDRRTDGVLFESFDAKAALPVCEKAAGQAPQDIQTRYHLARINDRLGNTRAAMDGYLDLSGDKYAVALRGVARLMDMDKEGRFEDLGKSSDWMERSARAGDPWALGWLATNAALDAENPRGIDDAVAMLVSAGIANRAEIMIRLSNLVAERGNTQAIVQRALFFALLGRELDETAVDRSPFLLPQLRQNIAEHVRYLAQAIPPASVVSLYRQARDWRAASGTSQ